MRGVLRIVALLLFVSASAVTATEGDHLCFSLVDANGDGTVNREEFDEHYDNPNLFGLLDANGDGSLSHEEYERGMKERGE